MAGYRTVSVAASFLDQSRDKPDLKKTRIFRRAGSGLDRMRRVPLSGVRQSGAVLGSVHYFGGIFSVVFGIISVPPFCWSAKRALLSFCGLEQARKCVVLGALGRRKSGLIGLSHIRSKRRPVLEVGFPPRGGSARPVLPGGGLGR
jgi:hypothetical protein